MDIYPRGSEWRRWDLHVHTPETKKNDNYKGADSTEKWRNFYDAISKYVGDGSDPLRDIAVVGITDYCSIDNYYKVLQEKKLPQSIKLILPNVELRITPTSKDAPTNIHCIFNPNFADKLENRFFSKLLVHYKGRDMSATRAGLIDLGRAFSDDDTLDEEKAYKVGLDHFVIEESRFEEVFNDKELRDNTIIVVSNSNNDGASGITQNKAYNIDGGSQLDASRRAIYQISDMIFSSNPKDRMFFLGLGVDSKEDVVKQYGSLKPCIHGSDAHSIEQLFEPQNKRYCWIKADPTFNGLKQLLYEPESRVCISEAKPIDKAGYQVIKSIQIGDSNVQEEEIVFNEKLTCIVGGKSTGKSLLLHNLAYSIDPEQVLSKVENKSIESINKRTLNNVVVTWKDGTKTGDVDAKGRKIIYIPQTYLNRLSDEKEEKSEIDKIIRDVVLVSQEAKTADSGMEKKLAENKEIIEKKIYETVRLKSTITNKEADLQEVGSVTSIVKEIEKLEEQRIKLTSEGKISEEDVIAYNKASLEIDELKERRQHLESDRDFVQSTEMILHDIFIPHMFSEEVETDVNKLIQNIKDDVNFKWNKEKCQIINSINDILEGINKSILEDEKVIESLRPKIEENKAVKIISESMQEENKKLEIAKKLENEIKEHNTEKERLIKELAEGFVQYGSIHEEYAVTINSKLCINRDDLIFSVETPVRVDAFTESIKRVFDNRVLRTKRDIIDIDKIEPEWFEKEKIERVIQAVLDENIKVIGSLNIENALRELLSDWYNTVYKVSMENDSIDGMSPGKKALVLLKLLIDLAESKCPILIDQPEDDLDNRSIYNELIPFIKNKKDERQIIVVTHNANVVLGGDAEEIIVANQDGKTSKNKSRRFEYRSGAIEEDRKIDDASLLNSQGIQQHICSILEGGETAFELRKHKYQIQD